MDKYESPSGDGSVSVLTKESEPAKESELTKGSAVQCTGGPKGNERFEVWPTPRLQNGRAEQRATHFSSLQKKTSCPSKRPRGHQAATLLDLMTIRALHSKTLRCFSLGTALGFRIRGGVQTDIPAIIVFVARKVHRHWLQEAQELPLILEGPGGVWCDVDVVEFSLLGSQRPQDPVYTDLVEGLRGGDATIGSGSQVACFELYGTLSAIVRSRTGLCQVGFLTNRHVAVSLDHPVQKLFHPLPPHLGPGVYLGAVERTTTFIRDDLWYGVFASTNPESFVRADGAFIPFDSNLDVRNFISPFVKSVGEIGEVISVDLQAPLNSLIGKHVIKVGRSSGFTEGCILAYALEYNNDKGHCFFNDFLIVSDDNNAFELEGDTGSLILVRGEAGEKPRPVGVVWGGTTQQGRLKLHKWKEPENWTSGVDLSRLLESLDLSIVTSNEALCEALEVQRQCRAASFHQSTPCLTIRSPLSTMLSSRHIHQMDGGSLKFDLHDTVMCRSSETLKDLLSTATFETSATQSEVKELAILPSPKNALDLSSRKIQTARRKATNSILFTIDDPFKLSLSSPLSGVEHCSNLKEWHQGMNGCGRLPKAASFFECFQSRTKKLRPLSDSRFVQPNS
ncbi:protein NARROW LEAF 1 [Physcomitrium patens]|uniref:Trypsin family protein n=1 Tax=Physcomitrium patens TaxID=3218 RepID=A0A2K1IQS3_PHYPA|nr:uncharacterized protein LOC112274344 [Physcomitrium patens]PNR31631.1 hypothetical protein PHYPA_025752 [Physcomitrium patens]|eukprot:XP_024359532.1 uncharacterized protein LOC112274344 [Physcomitrella patens]